MPASWRTFTHAAKHCSSVPYSCSNSASVNPCMIARIDPIPCLLESILHRFRGGRKGGDWLISGNSKPAYQPISPLCVYGPAGEAGGACGSAAQCADHAAHVAPVVG